MTLSILAFDRDSGTFGGAAMTGNLAVGAWVLAVEAGVGAVASQGLCVSTLWRDGALNSLRQGRSADQTLYEIVGVDSGRDSRQLAVLDGNGHCAAWTGSGNPSAKGHIVGDGYVIAGNWLGSDDVLTAMQTRYLARWETDVGERLLSVLSAGVRAGGDERGMQSAAMRLANSTAPPLDLRIDSHHEPLAELQSLYRKTGAADYAAWLATLPTIEAPYRC